MEISEARYIASLWHGGQWSALYSFSSSGFIDKWGLLGELRRCSTDDAFDQEQLNELIDWVDEQDDDSQEES